MNVMTEYVGVVLCYVKAKVVRVQVEGLKGTSGRQGSFIVEHLERCWKVRKCQGVVRCMGLYVAWVKY